MPSERILVIEDEARIAQFIERGLIYEGYRVNVARDGQSMTTIWRLELRASRSASSAVSAGFTSSWTRSG